MNVSKNGLPFPPKANPAWVLAVPLSLTQQTAAVDCTINPFGGTVPPNNGVEMPFGTVALPSIAARGTAVVAGAV
jgi:hypothetical protein